jgi:hypothetical protein
MRYDHGITIKACTMVLERQAIPTTCQPLDYQSLSAVTDKSDEIYSTFAEGLAPERTFMRFPPRPLVRYSFLGISSPQG